MADTDVPRGEMPGSESKEKTESTSEGQGDQKRSVGVRGWLLVLCILLTVLRGLAFLFMILTAVFANDTSKLVVLLFAVYSAYGLSVGILLWSKVRMSVSYAKFFFIAQPAILFGLWSLLLQQDPSSATEALRAIIGGTIGSIVWFSYLTFSKRVRDTYQVDQRKRNVLVALAIGAILGPLGTVYFHLRVLLATVIAAVLAGVLATLTAVLSGVPIPPWMPWVWFGFFPIALAIMAVFWNDAQETSSDQWTTAAALSIGLGTWMFRIFGISAGLYEGISLFGSHRIFAGLLALILVPTLMSLGARLAMNLIVLITGLSVAVGSSLRKRI
jgi:hypothetical protein